MRILLSFLLMAGFFDLSPMASSRQMTNGVTSVYSDTNAANNFRLVLRFPKATFTNGESVICQFGLTNISDTGTIVVPSLFEENVHFLVTNASGLRIKPLEADYSLQPYGGPELVPPHSMEKSYYGLYPISWFLAFTPGTYQVCYVREFGNPSNLMMTSKVVTITILDSPVSSATNSPAQKPK